MFKNSPPCDANRKRFKKGTKLVSLFLTVLMVVSLFSVGIVTTNAVTTETFKDENGVTWEFRECYPGWAVKCKQYVGNKPAVIPSYYKNKVVFAIDERAFPYGFGPREIVIPETITYICSNAFFNNTYIKTLNIPDTVTTLAPEAFYNFTNLESITLGKGIKKISDRCFQECDNLKTINIPSNVEEIGDYAFAYRGYGGYIRNRTINFSNGLKRIGNNAFYGNSGLNFELPDTIEYIGDRAFYKTFTSKTHVIIPNSCKYIGAWAFSDAFLIGEYLEINGNNLIIEDSAFYGFGNNSLDNYHPENNKDVKLIINEGVKGIGQCSFGQGGLRATKYDLTLPNSLEYFYLDAEQSTGSFSWYGSETDKKIYATSNCEARYLSPYEFYTDEEGNPTERAASGNFATDLNYKWIECEDPWQDNSEYFSLNGIDYCVKPYLDGWEISYAGERSSNYDLIEFEGLLEIPDSYKNKPIRKISDSGFYNIFNITKIIIPDTVYEIGNGSFRGGTDWGENTKNSQLHEIQLGNNIKKIDSEAFTENWNLNGTLTIPDSVEEIGDYAFPRNAGFSKIILGSGLKKIGDDVFYGGNINWNNLKIEDLEEIGAKSFYNTQITNLTFNKNQKIKYMAFGCDYDYDQKTIELLSLDVENLSEFDELIICGRNVINIKLSNNLRNIDTALLSGNPQLEELTLNENIEVSSLYAFYGDDNLTVYTPVNAVTNGLRRAADFAEVPVVVYDGIIKAGGSKEVPVILDAAENTFSVTVPTVLPIAVDADHNVSVAENAKITNNTKGPVSVDSVTISGNDTWAYTSEHKDYTKQPVDLKEFWMQIDDFDTINGYTTTPVNYQADVAVQSSVKTGDILGSVVFVVNWFKG